VSDKNNTDQPQVDENELIRQRREKLDAWRESTQAYPNTFKPENLAGDLISKYGDIEKLELEELNVQVSVAGRMMSQRIMGKASFAHLQDRSERVQVYVSRDSLPEGFYMKDKETSYRQRYVDLIINEHSRKVFTTRSKIVNFIRNFLIEKEFLEVETPMMQAIPGGAVARPFVTHHNALDMQLFLRIAPELYLKRLVVGGFERVFEINRNFRNEGLSTRHNPEFTMLEFYQAYADYNDLMDITEEMFKGIAQSVTDDGVVHYQQQNIDFNKPFKRMTVAESILHFNPKLTENDLQDRAKLVDYAKELKVLIKDSYGLGKVQIEIFEKTVEERLAEPTFITAYPVEVSPLSRRNDDDDFVTDRFELFIAGREIANGFSELNDPEDQANRFQAQVCLQPRVRVLVLIEW